MTYNFYQTESSVKSSDVSTVGSLKASGGTKNGQHQSKQFGRVAILGAPNVGKSTLTNLLVGQKISIVSKKPQTTRFRITGIRQDKNCQMVLIDTPGIFSPKGRFDKIMIKEAWNALSQIDVILLLMNGQLAITHSLQYNIIKQLQDKKKSLAADQILPLWVVINKIDLVPKSQLLALVKNLETVGLTKIFLISALKGDGVQDLIYALTQAMPYGEWQFSPDEVSTLPDRLFVAEILRESLFHFLHQELPYGLTVETEQWDFTGEELTSESFREKKIDEVEFIGSAFNELKLNQKNLSNNQKKLTTHKIQPLTRPRLLRLAQVIHIMKPQHRAMILGKGGATLKKIASRARLEMERQLGCRVFLTVFVRVTPKWQESPHLTTIFSHYS